MLRMTKQADYAIVLLTRMASEPESQFNASEIAEQTGLPQPIVSKILKLLTRRELLTSHRGAKGGYRLAHTAGDITVAQIIEAVEGPLPSRSVSTRTPESARRNLSARSAAIGNRSISQSAMPWKR
jgi:Rrf2 family protein